MKLGFIGLGKMGKPMALNLMKQGHELFIYNRSRQVVDELAALGAIPADSPSIVGLSAEAVFTNLPVGKDVENVLTGESGLLSTLRSGAIVIDHSTISPDDSKRIYEICKLQGINFLDAPVSGGVSGAENGTLSIMVGGDRQVYDRALPLLQVLGKNIVYLGSSGSGSVMKLVNNMLVGITNVAVAEGLVLAAKNGLDPHQVFDILCTSSGDSSTLRRNMSNHISKRDFTPKFTLDMLNKDMGLAQDLALNQGVRLLLGSLAYQMNREAAYHGLGQEDFSAVIKVLEKITNIEVCGN